ncbi:hypothetical protein [Priestia megaterium]|nr:hypothetical protein [Priestia megaterium]
MKKLIGMSIKNSICTVEFIYLYALLSFVELHVVIVKSLSMK